MNPPQKNKKSVQPLDQNNDQMVSTRILINQLQEIQISKIQKNTKEKQLIVNHLKNKGMTK